MAVNYAKGPSYVSCGRGDGATFPLTPCLEEISLPQGSIYQKLNECNKRTVIQLFLN
jgi:hypothetical protein